VATFLLRVELPDRPGALGAVASRIGAVRGDLVAVEVVEHREGKAVDEFVVELADGDHLSLLLSEIAEVDGVALQDVRPVSGRRHDRRLEAYTTALIILRERTPHGVLGALSSRVCAELDATWSAVLDVEGLSVIASQGRPPATPWLAASLADARAASVDSDDVIDVGLRPKGADGGDIGFVDLAAWDLVLAAGRPGWRFGTRERAHLVALAQLADARWPDMADRDSGISHPSRAG
jgi:ACT domain